MRRADLSIYLSVYLSVYLSIYPSVYLSIDHFCAIDGDGGGPIDFANTGLPAGKAWPAHRALSLSGGKVAGSLNIAVAVK